MSFKALLTRKTDTGVATELVDFDEANLMEGDVLVQVEYSTLNYKDALALTNERPVMRTYPLIPGIDLAGVVLESSNAEFKTGDRVVLNGWDLSMGHHGGLAQRARVRGEWLNRIPGNLTTRDAMAIGTAGYTAMLCVLALEDAGVTPDKGDVLVTGANGGVGSIAVAILSKLGYRVVAATGRPEHAEYLHSLGAAEIIDRAQFSEPRERPVSKERWAGVVDVAGGPTLVNAIAETKYRGAVAACGLAQSDVLHGSVIPFILRNVTLAGVDSVNAPQEVRQRAWDRLATDLDPQKLESTVQQIGLAEVLNVYEQIIPGKVRGRIVVDVNA
ncbi:acrylyl-CoA reductase (NADPH) [Stenotrophomonas tuberculopleuritidis]|uniref:acrylyl-CoA reductase (NADPH) n=1 Tax=Stenotrophomonas tuberculopleuritidis TaxID=3055079 RepID=UPI0026E55F99|nr:MDR family oxidoreductase [Stenotrophomonas sp. 704A1]